MQHLMLIVLLQALRQQDIERGYISTGVLNRLVHIAIASARLHHRDTVLAMPDAVLAIILFESSNEARVSPSQCMPHKPSQCMHICSLIQKHPPAFQRKERLSDVWTLQDRGGDALNSTLMC